MRADLLALTPDALAALTNRGLLKRAAREVEAGTGPAVSTGPDGTVRGEHPDGARSALPPGTGLDSGTCSCAATGICRHLLALVLAYQRDGTAPAVDTGGAPTFDVWSPGEFTDAAIEELIGARQLAAARRTFRTGYPARVRRPTPADPVPSVELPAATVRFLVPHELGYAHTDAADGTREQLVALAVWAFRAADAAARDAAAPGATSPDAAEVRLDVGAERVAATSPSGLDAALGLAEEVLLDGATQAGPALRSAVARVRQDLDRRGLRWPLLALDELAEQLEAYHARSARYRAERVAEVLAELAARDRAVANGGASLRSRVLGTEEAGETPLRRVRLTGLGCRVAATADERVAEIFLAQPDAGTVLVLRRRWPAGDGTAQLGGRRVGGQTVAALAAGNVVTESAVRSASRTVRLASSRVARTTCTPSGGAWGTLPDSLLVRDLAALRRVFDELPPRLVRPRVEAEFVRVVELGAVRSIGYAPGDQYLQAVVEDPAGGVATIHAEHRAQCPAALDALAEALDGSPRYVAGTLHRTGGRFVIEPVAVAVAGTVVVPDLAAGTGAAPLDVDAGPVREPIPAALGEALTVLAEAAHRGLRHLPGTFAGRLGTVAESLRRVGLHRAAAAVDRFAQALSPEPGARAATAWLDAQLRLLVTADLS